MRTWSVLADLRHAPSTWTACRNYNTHHRIELPVVEYVGSRSVFSRFRILWVRLIDIHPVNRSPYSAQTPICLSNTAWPKRRRARGICKARIVRHFSNTRCARIKFEEDDEEDQPTQSAPLSTTYRPRPSGRHIPVRAELGHLIKSRRTAPPPPPKPFNPAELRAIDQKAKRVFSLDVPGLAREYLQLKWAHLEGHVQLCAEINRELHDGYYEVISARVDQMVSLVLQSRATCQDLEHQYCKVVFRGLPRLTRDVLQAENDTTKLRAVISAALVKVSFSTIADLRREVLYFLRPRDSARAKVDGLLNYSTHLGQRYIALRDKHSVVKVGILDIINQCRGLGTDFRKFYEKLTTHEPEYTNAAHWYRYAWLAKQKRLDPLRAAELWDMARSPAPVPAPNFDPISALLFDDKQHIAARQKLENRCVYQLRLIRTLYMRKWKPGLSSESPELDMHWRQLDVMAPFFMQLLHYTWLLSECRYLLITLSGQLGPLWSNIGPDRLAHHKSAMFEMVRRVRADQLDLLRELQAYRSINWIRLGIERRLQRFNEPNEIRQDGYFVVSNPMSQDLARFEQWIRDYVSWSHFTFISRRAIHYDKLVTGQIWEKRFRTIDDIERQEYLTKRAEAMDLGYVSLPRSGRIRPALPRRQAIKKPQKTHDDDDIFEHIEAPDDIEETVADSSYGIDKQLHGKPLNEWKSISAVVPQEKGPKTFARSLKYPGYQRQIHTARAALSDGIPSQKAPPAVFSARFEASPVHRAGSSKRAYSTFVTSSVRKTHEEVRLDNALEQSSDLRISTTEITNTTTSLTEEPLPAIDEPPRQFWSHISQRGPNGRKPIVHYCRTLESTEEVSKLFLKSKVIGFDMEWKAQATASDTIQNNLSLIQIANEERIALFQISLFKPARTLDDFVAPSLKHLLESTEITKVGVSIKADATRLRKFLGIDTRSIFELSHLFKLVKYARTEPKLVNKRMINLSEQMQEHFGLPLEKSEDVRCGDWTRPLNYRQVQCKFHFNY